MKDIDFNLKTNEYPIGDQVNEELRSIDENFKEILSLDVVNPVSTILIKSPGNTAETAENGDWKFYIDDNSNLITAKMKAGAWEITDTNTF